MKAFGGHLSFRLLLIVLLGFPAGRLHAQVKSEAERAWEAKVGEKARSNPAYAFVEDDPALPRALLIGDSISIGYTAEVRTQLQGKANVHRIPTNGGDTNRGLASIDAWLGDGRWDVIHFNWGLHDIKRVKEGQLDASADRVLTPEAYQANLEALVTRLKKTGATLIWAATTPVPQGAAGRIPGDEIAYNALASAIMAGHDVQVNDLHGYIAPQLATRQRPANVHFEAEGSAALGQKVAEVIAEALKTAATGAPGTP